MGLLKAASRCIIFWNRHSQLMLVSSLTPCAVRRRRKRREFIRPYQFQVYIVQDDVGKWDRKTGTLPGLSLLQARLRNFGNQIAS